jgi:hypothetical protein
LIALGKVEPFAGKNKGHLKASAQLDKATYPTIPWPQNFSSLEKKKIAVT